MFISMIYTTSQDGILRYNNSIPWKIDIVMARYTAATQGKMLIVGRKTWEALPELVSQNATIVLSSLPLADKKVKQAGTLAAAIAMAKKTGRSEIVIVGGAQLFREAIGLCHVIYKTTLLIDVQGNIYSPIIPNARFKLVWVKNFKMHPAYSYQTYVLKELEGKKLTADFGLLHLK